MAVLESRKPPPVVAGEGPKKSTGEGLRNKDTIGNREAYARERYRLDGRIKRILRADAKRRFPDRFPGDVHRTIDCTWARIADLSVVLPVEHKGAHYKGLATCGSVHTCPICASKIQERRRLEVAQGITWAGEQGRAGFMVSFTFPHRIDQPLSVLLKLQQKALAHMRGGRAYKELMKRCLSVGRIRSLEVTHGQNGWHPHTHELLFLDPDVPAAWLRDQLIDLWFKSCKKVGLFVSTRDRECDFRCHAVDVSDADGGAADYLAKMDDQTKWGISHELTKSSSKQGRRSGAHPFKLANDPATHGLFLEYVQAMKGSRQLVWSRGLKAAVGVDEKTDDELAREEVARALDQIPVDPLAWQYILGNDARCELLQVAEVGGAPAVFEFLILLGYKEPS